MNKKKFAVILSGCGAFDGSEISETTFALLSLSINGIEYEGFAPDINFQSVNHYSFSDKEKSSSQRNMLEESARIMGNKVRNLDCLNLDEFDGLLFPGGFGAKEHLSKIKKIDEIIKSAHNQKKPIIAICIAPCLLAKNIENAKITYGPDENFRTGLELPGTEVISKNSDEFLFDEKNNLYTTPAFMSSVVTGLNTELKTIFNGVNATISNAILNILKL